MDNAQKAIMIGVGLFITIIIISAVLLVVNLGSGLMEDATSKLGSITGSLKSQLLDGWAGKTKSGSEVKAFVRQYATDDAVAIYIHATTPVYTGGGAIANADGKLSNKANYTSGGITGCTIDATKTTSSYTEVIDANIISDTSYYRTAVCYDANDNVIGVAIILDK